MRYITPCMLGYQGHPFFGCTYIQSSPTSLHLKRYRWNQTVLLSSCVTLYYTLHTDISNPHYDSLLCMITGNSDHSKVCHRNYRSAWLHCPRKFSQLGNVQHLSACTLVTTFSRNYNFLACQTSVSIERNSHQALTKEHDQNIQSSLWILFAWLLFLLWKPPVMMLCTTILSVLSAGCTCCCLSYSKPAPTCKILHPLHEDDWEKTCTENVRKTYVCEDGAQKLTCSNLIPMQSLLMLVLYPGLV